GTDGRPPDAEVVLLFRVPTSRSAFGSAPKLVHETLELAPIPRRLAPASNLDAHPLSRYEHRRLEGGRLGELGERAQQLEVRLAERLHGHDRQRALVPQVGPRA